MTLDVAAIGRVEVNGVGVERQSAIAEEQGGVWNQNVGEGWAMLCCCMSAKLRLFQ
jgi:hypothetical protein